MSHAVDDARLKIGDIAVQTQGREESMTDGGHDVGSAGCQGQAGGLRDALFQHGVEEDLDAVGSSKVHNLLSAQNTTVLSDLDTRTKKPVFSEILHRFPVSIKLSAISIAFAVLIGIPLGVYSATHQYSVPDQILRVGSMFFVAVPPFWFAMMLILVFALNLGWLPTSGNSTFLHYILPMITLGMPYGGKFLRITRSTMLEVIRSDYITTAKAKGVPQRRITFTHALKNALLPVITTVATSFGGLLGGAIITESVFNMNGLGSLIVLSIKMKDTPTVMASIILLAVMFTIIMLIVDLIYAFIDPRIKAKYIKG